MNLGGYSKVAIHFGSLAVNHYHSQTCPLGFILCEGGVRIVGLEILNLLEVCSLWHRTHGAELVLILKSPQQALL